MAGLGDIIAGAVQGVADLGRFGYSIYQDQRDSRMTQEQWDYKKAMDIIQMQREDTAVQRKVADLEKAGLNKNLASGSGASAGVGASTPSPVSRQLADIDLSKVFDFAMARKAVKEKDQDIAFANTSLQMLKDEQKTAQFENLIRKAQALSLLGIPVTGIGRDSNGWHPFYPEDWEISHFRPETGYYHLDGNIPLLRRISAETARQEYLSDMARKENSMYYVNQFAGLAGDTADIVFGARRAFGKKGSLNIQQSNFNYNPWRKYWKY